MKKALVLFATLLAAIALVACGDDDDDDGGGAAAETTTEATTGGGGAGAAGGATTLQLSADPSGALAYDTDSLNAKAGSVTIDFTNPAAISHDVAVEQGGNELGKSDLIAEGSTTLQLSDVQPGEYTFFCTVPGHREGGMEGTLTVK
jgi:plastocyanin